MAVRGDRERGAAVVEFAMIAPILFGVLFAIVDVSRVWNFRAQLTNSTTAAARYYSIPQTAKTTAQMQSEAKDMVKSNVTDLPTSATFEFCVDSVCGTSAACPSSGGSSSVAKLTVTADVPTWTRFLGTSFHVSSSAIAACN